MKTGLKHFYLRPLVARNAPVVAPSNTRRNLPAPSSCRLRNEFFFSAPQLERDS